MVFYRRQITLPYGEANGDGDGESSLEHHTNHQDLKLMVRLKITIAYFWLLATDTFNKLRKYRRFLAQKHCPRD